MLHAVWHWRQTTAEKLDVPPFKVTSGDLLLRLAQAADAGATTVAAVLAGIHLGKRHQRLIASLTVAVQDGLAKDPASLPRRRGRQPGFASLTHAEVALQDRIKADRDRAAVKLALDPTLIASRGQLAQLARDPGRLDEILLPWQAGLLRDAPALVACRT
jgi:ribonuclease D